MACYSIGLDLGQARDYSALVLVERVQVFDPTHTEPMRYAATDDPDDEREVFDLYHVRYLHRWSLGTDYATVADDVAQLYEDRRLDYALLTVDRTGVGGGVVDMLKQHHLDGRLGAQAMRPLTLTAGHSNRVATEGWAWTTAHKGDVVHRLLTLTQRGRVKVDPALPGADELLKELRAFELKQNVRTGHVRYEAARESDHDDYVMALAMALWFTNRGEEPRYVGPDGALYEKLAA